MKLSELSAKGGERGKGFSVEWSVSEVYVYAPATVSVKATGRYCYDFVPNGETDADELEQKHLNRAKLYKNAFSQKIRDAAKTVIFNTRGAASYETPANPWQVFVDLEMDIDENVQSVKSMG